MCKVSAIELDGIDTGLRFDDLRDLFKQHATFSGTSAAAKRLKEALDYLDRAFPSKSARLKNRTVVQSLMTLACRVIATGRAKGHEKRLAQFADTFMTELSRQVQLGAAATDPDYLRFQRSVNANVRAAARVRQEILLRKLFTLQPELADAFDSGSVLESGITGRVGELGESIRELVERANEIHSALDGTDFFKATSKTAQALVRIGKPVKSLAEYKRFIDDLYFLFREGPGERLKDKWPTSFADINTLRTELRHDVDHGASGKVRRKRRKAGSTFMRLSGAVSPQGADPARFPLTQVNLLSAIDNDLRTLVGQLQVTGAA